MKEDLLKNLTVAELLEPLVDAFKFLRLITRDVPKSSSIPSVYNRLVGKRIFIRTITYHYTGKLMEVTPDALVLKEAAWIPDDGRFSEVMRTGKFLEKEPYPPDREVIIERGALLDVCEISVK